LLHCLPEFALYYGLMLSGMAFLLVPDLTYVDRVGQEFVEGSP
jgi:hypothetical protein